MKIKTATKLINELSEELTTESFKKDNENHGKSETIKPSRVSNGLILNL